MEKGASSAAKEYAARRAHALKHLDPQETAMLILLENLSALDQTEGSTRHHTHWHAGHPSEELLRSVLRGRTSSLPIPGRYGHTPDYERFNWKINDPQGRRLRFFGVQVRFEKGHISMQEVEGENFFSEVNGEVARIVDTVPYPISVRDQNGFSYENPSFVIARLNQKKT